MLTQMVRKVTTGVQILRINFVLNLLKTFAKEVRNVVTVFFYDVG